MTHPTFNFFYLGVHFHLSFSYLFMHHYSCISTCVSNVPFKVFRCLFICQYEVAAQLQPISLPHELMQNSLAKVTLKASHRETEVRASEVNKNREYHN